MSTHASRGRACAAALLLLAACRGGDRADATADTAVSPRVDSTAPRPTDSATVKPADTTKSPTPTASVDSTPILLVAADSVLGDSLYHNSRGRCITCHGPRGTGNASLGPSLRDSIWLDTDGSARGIATIIHDGVAEPKGGSARMPAFGNQLDSLSIRRIAVYVYSLSHPGGLARDSATARERLGVGADSTSH